MFRICKRYTFEASHRLPKHKGKCRNRHGHSYKVDVTIQGNVLEHSGPEKLMLMDFDVLDEVVRPMIELLDHTHLNRSSLLTRPEDKKFYPTAENIAGALYDLIQQRLGYPNVSLYSVRVWETEKCWAERA